MKNKNNFKEERFDSFLNKTIILSSKKYYRNEITKEMKELKIIDDENNFEYMNNYLMHDDEIYNLKDVDNFIEFFNNPMLVSALKSLSNIEMTVIFLLFEKQLTSKEASQILKICADSVTRIKRRALNKIKKYFKGDVS